MSLSVSIESRAAHLSEVINLEMTLDENASCSFGPDTILASDTESTP
jgi:hypothetical protein